MIPPRNELVMNRTDLEQAAWVADDVRRTTPGSRAAEMRFEFEAASMQDVRRALSAIGVRALRASVTDSGDMAIVRVTLPRSRVDVVVLACLAHGGRYLRPFQFPPMSA